MTKQGSTGKAKLEAAMQSRSPIAQREAIIPVDILEAAVEPLGKTERKNRTVEANIKSVRKERTKKANAKTEQKKRVILAEPEKPETVRDSYEAYVEQLETIEKLQALYRKKTDRPLTKSRIIREALAYFLPQALDAYEDDGNYEDEQQPKETIEERFRTDTQVHHFKKWIRSHDQPQDTNFFKRFLADGQLPEHASRGLYEAKMRSAGYSDEDVYLFQDAWRSMIAEDLE